MLEYFRAFLTLATRRPRSADGGINPIPFTDILAYVSMFETDDTEMMVHCVIEMDSALMKHLQEKQNTKVNTDGRSGTNVKS